MIALCQMYRDKFHCTLLLGHNSAALQVPGIEVIISPKFTNHADEINWIYEQFGHRRAVFLDGYEFDSSYQKLVKKHFPFLVAIDDKGDQHIYADVVINHSPGAVDMVYTTEPSTRKAFGPSYALLRPHFLQEAKAPPRLRDGSNVFICFGGADLEHLTERTLGLLLNYDCVDAVEVVLASAYSPQDSLSKHPKVHLHKGLNEREMITVIDSCDMAIVPSSTILFEVSCLKVPCMSGFYVDNQEGIYAGYLKHNAIFGVGNFLEMSDDEYGKKLGEFILMDKNDLMKNQALLLDGNSKERYLSLLP